MNILQVNKFLWQSGGPERVMIELSDILRAHNHEVEFFAMDHPKNLPSRNKEYFVRFIDYRNNSIPYILRHTLRAAEQTIYSRESRRKISALLRQRSYDLAHVHMIEHQISPSVLPALREHGVPIVHTCHDHKLVCPESHLYMQSKSEVCERCVDTGAYYNIILGRCMRGSLAVSALAGVAEYIHRWSGIYEKNVNIFIAPSRFLADRLVRGGIPEHKVRVLGNAVDLAQYKPTGAESGFVLYFGRLSVEKGLYTLLKAAARVPGIPFKIAGDGPIADELGRFLLEKGINNVELVGYQAGDQLKQLIDESRLVVLPSECHENCPMVTLEAYAMGKPVVATRVGGTPENIEEGETGHLVEPGNDEQLADGVGRLYHDRDACVAMGRQGRAKVERICAQYYAKTLAIYEEARSAL